MPPEQVGKIYNVLNLKSHSKWRHEMLDTVFDMSNDAHHEQTETNSKTRLTRKISNSLSTSGENFDNQVLKTFWTFINYIIYLGAYLPR